MSTSTRAPTTTRSARSSSRRSCAASRCTSPRAIRARSRSRSRRRRRRDGQEAGDVAVRLRARPRRLRQLHRELPVVQRLLERRGHALTPRDKAEISGLRERRPQSPAAARPSTAREVSLDTIALADRRRCGAAWLCNRCWSIGASSTDASRRRQGPVSLQLDDEGRRSSGIGSSPTIRAATGSRSLYFVGYIVEQLQRARTRSARRFAQYPTHEIIATGIGAQGQDHARAVADRARRGHPSDAAPHARRPRRSIEVQVGDHIDLSLGVLDREARAAGPRPRRDRSERLRAAVAAVVRRSAAGQRLLQRAHPLGSARTARATIASTISSASRNSREESTAKLARAGSAVSSAT